MAVVPTVREILDPYLNGRSVSALARELNDAGHTVSRVQVDNVLRGNRGASAELMDALRRLLNLPDEAVSALVAAVANRPDLSGDLDGTSAGV